MVIPVNEEKLFQANFNKRRSGLTGSVYYTLYKHDGTIYQARTSSGVTEYGDAKYGVKLTLNFYGNLSIYWDIDGTNIDASEEIQITDFTAGQIYRGYAH